VSRGTERNFFHRPSTGKVPLHLTEIPSGGSASELNSFLAERERVLVQHVAVQRRVLILFGLLHMLVTVLGLVSLLVFSSLEAVRFGLSQLPVRGSRSSPYSVEGRYRRGKMGRQPGRLGRRVRVRGGGQDSDASRITGLVLYSQKRRRHHGGPEECHKWTMPRRSWETGKASTRVSRATLTRDSPSTHPAHAVQDKSGIRG
jgi:hypothetical protein